MPFATSLSLQIDVFLTPPNLPFPELFSAIMSPDYSLPYSCECISWQLDKHNLHLNVYFFFFKHPMLWKTSSLCLLSPWCILRILFQAVFEESYTLFWGDIHSMFYVYSQLTTAQILLHVSQSTASRAYMISIYSLMMIVILITLSMCGPYFLLCS